MTEITNPHDSCFRTLMSQPENARAFFARYLTSELKERINLDTLVLQSGRVLSHKYEY